MANPTSPPHTDSFLLEELNPAQLVRAIIDKLWLLATIVIVFALLGLAYLKWETPRYTSEALLEVPTEAETVIGFQEVLGDDLKASDIMRTLERTLVRAGILEQVLQDPDIRDRPRLREPLKDTDSAPTQEQLLDAFREWTKARHLPGTRLISISVTHTSPEIARDLANAIPRTYIRERLRLQADTSESAFQFLLEEAERLRQKLQQSEDILQDFSKAVEIKGQIVDQEVVVAELSQRYRSKHPRMIQANNLLNQLQDQFRRELVNSRARVGDDSRFWGTTLDQLEALSGEERIREELKLLESRFNVLSRELESDRMLYDAIVTRMKETDVTSEVQQAPFRIAERARLAKEPSWPKPLMIMAAALFLGGGIGLLGVFILELADNTIHTVDDAENKLQLPIMATVPRHKANPKEKQGELIILSEPSSPAAEAYRTLRASLKLLGRSDTKKKLLVTSSIPGEGKSIVAANLAVAFAQDGESTLLIDADLRRNRISQLFDLDHPQSGIVKYLTDKKLLTSCCIDSGIDGLDLLPVHQKVPRPAELLDSHAFGELILEAEKSYDRIIIDTPPVNAVADPLLIATHCQAVLFVCKAHATPLRVTRHALRQLGRIQQEPAGIVLNQVKKNPRSGPNRYYYHYSSGDEYGQAYGS
jgi:capsular exopolysaccharide synthesis family protein